MLEEIKEEIDLPKGIYVIGEGGDRGFEGLIEKGDESLPDVERDNDALAVLHYTSGSSGVLKAAMQSFGNRLEGVKKYALFPGTRMEAGEIRAHVGPMTHATGKFVSPTLFFGGCIRIFSKFDAAALAKTIQEEGIHHLFLVPTMLNRLVNLEGVENYNFSSLRSIVYGGSPSSPTLLEKATRLFGPILTQLYGAGEVTGGVTVLTGADHAAALSGNKALFASCGRNIGFTDVFILNEDGKPVGVGEIGEIVFRGNDVMLGYWGAPDLTAECLKDGAYYTGDMGKIDENGYIFIVDRKKDMIISGGFNVYSSEVENVLMQHPAVFEAAVFGVPDENWGESVKAVVTVKSGKTVSDTELIDFCAEQLARYKKPASIDFIDEMPKNKNGKIQKKAIRERYWQGHERRVG
jgi:acyl-CoA synthetase (AMP-forming)/AMP-acid ligase II